MSRDYEKELINSTRKKRRRARLETQFDIVIDKIKIIVLLVMLILFSKIIF